MTRRSIWVALGLTIFVIASLALIGAQPSNTSATIQDIYDLLTNEEGVNRLDLMEEEIVYIHEKVDLIHSVAKRMLEEEYRFFDKEEWTLSDIKYHLNQIDLMLSDIRLKTDCIDCP